MQSPSPTVTDLVKINAPTIDGLANKSFTTPSQIFLLSGECDTRSYEVDLAVDGGAYKQIFDNCREGTFKQTVDVVKAVTTFSVRAKGKFSFTDPAVAKVTFIPPPTAPFQSFVQSSQSDNSDLVGPGSQNAMGLSFQGNPLSSSQNHVDTYLPGSAYAP